MKIKNQHGFTLIEMIMVIVIMAIVAAILGPFLSQPFAAYQSLSQRAELVSKLNSTMDQMAKDIAQSVPNSVREDGVGVGGTTLEMMHTQAFGRYRYSDTIADTDALTPTQADSAFNVLGDIGDVSSTRVIVNNVDVDTLYSAAMAGVQDPEGNIIPRQGIITPRGMIVTSSSSNGETHIVLGSAFQFDLIGIGSPSKRVYFSDTAVRYVCANGQINRISGYQPEADIATTINATAALVVENVTDCSFTYNPATAQSSGLVTLNIQLTMGNQSVRLIQQVQVANAP